MQGNINKQNFPLLMLLQKRSALNICSGELQAASKIQGRWKPYLDITLHLTFGNALNKFYIGKRYYTYKYICNCTEADISVVIALNVDVEWQLYHYFISVQTLLLHRLIMCSWSAIISHRNFRKKQSTNTARVQKNSSYWKGI